MKKITNKPNEVMLDEKRVLIGGAPIKIVDSTDVGALYWDQAELERFKGLKIVLGTPGSGRVIRY